MVCSLFHLRYILTMCIHYFSGGKLLFTCLCIVSIPTQENDLWDKVVSVLFTCGTSWPCAFIYSQRVSYFPLVHTCLAFQLRRMICEIKVVCSLYHLWYILTMCIHLFSVGKLLSLVHACLAFQHRRMICEIKCFLSFPLVVLPDLVHSFTLSW